MWVSSMNYTCYRRCGSQTRCCDTRDEEQRKSSDQRMLKKRINIFQAGANGFDLLILLFNSIQNSNTLYMARLREEVKAHEALNRIAATLALATHQDAHVPSLRVHVAAHV